MFFLTRRGQVVAVLCLLAMLAGVSLSDCVHTDDGCTSQTRCPACQQQLSSVGVFTPHLVAVPAFAPIGAAVVPSAIAPVTTTPHGEVPRGPPSL
jgi:hypothetical protein